MTNALHSIQIHFLRVTDNALKQQRLCSVVHEHFAKGDRILIRVSTTEAANFVDQLLWKFPPESFTPHAIVSTATQEKVVITTADSNVNKAQILVNLSSQLPSFLDTVDVIYELFDTTTAEKEANSRARQAAYIKIGYNPSTTN